MSEILSKNTTFTGITILGKIDEESLAFFEAFMKHGHTFPQLFSNTKTPMKYVTIQGDQSTALAIPIPSLTPLETSYDLSGSEVINEDDLTPIVEEMPSSDFFFNKKRKAII
jgi:hypothetical protein